MLKQLKEKQPKWYEVTKWALACWVACIVLNGAYNFTVLFDIVVLGNLINLGALLVYARIQMEVNKIDKK